MFHELQSVAPLGNVVFNDLHSTALLVQSIFHEFQSVAPLDNQVIHELQSTCDWNTSTLLYPMATPAETTSSSPPGCSSSTVAQREIPAPSVAPHHQVHAAERHEPAEVKKNQKKTKYSEKSDCIICHHFVKRIDRHLLAFHGDFLTALDMKLIKDFYRFRECSVRVLMCYTCNRRFISKSTQEKRCSGQPKRLENHRMMEWMEWWWKKYRNAECSALIPRCRGRECIGFSWTELLAILRWKKRSSNKKYTLFMPNKFKKSIHSQWAIQKYFFFMPKKSKKIHL